MKMLKSSILIISLGLVLSNAKAQNVDQWKIQPNSIQTRWAKEVTLDNVLPEYPRPQLVRKQWVNLNGLWDYVITSKEDEAIPSKFVGKILVPFPIESALSGVKKTLLPTQRLWYKRTITQNTISKNKRILLHFGAVDWQATVYFNGNKLGNHSGGYQNFTFDITDLVKLGNNDLIVSVYDPTDQGPNPHGKQALKPQNILYTANSGIWQTVWMEEVPKSYIENITMTPSVDSSYLDLNVKHFGFSKNYQIEAITPNGSTKGQPNKSIHIPVNNPRLWSPEDPYLYPLCVRLLYKGKIIDSITTYFGMRKIEVKKDEKGIERLFLNNKYVYQLGVLDQGYWPEGLYTAPTDSAIQFDIMAIRNMGFNTIRKHVKIEPARWYYYTDKLGILVWQDMITCSGTTGEARDQFEIENRENINQLHNYPSIILYVLFNEGWSKYDQRRLTEWLKKEEPGRIINGHSGENYDLKSPKSISEKWIASDLTDIHEYPGPGIPDYLPGKARVLGEWGGIKVETKNHQWNSSNSWGYVQLSANNFANRYENMIKHLKVYEEEGLSGSIYTEPFDVETEENGFISYDREVIKIPIAKMREINSLISPNPQIFTQFNLGNNIALIDTSNNDANYSLLLEIYNKGKKDSLFLYNLSLMAKRVNDKINSEKIANDYIRITTNPFSKENLQFIFQYTNTSEDPGFEIIQKNINKVNLIIGANSGENKIMNIIYKEELERYTSDINSNIDWNRLQLKVHTKYGALGDEIILRARSYTYYKQKKWNDFAKVYSIYVQNHANRIDAGELNDFAWAIFKNVNDSTTIDQAINWSKLSLQKEEAYYTMDTYANLLYKNGRKEEALTIEQKAIQIADSDEYKKIYKETLIKMKNGEITWN